MNAWNTITKLDYRKTSQAQTILELICDESNMLIIEALRLSGSSSLIDLVVQTSLEQEQLVLQLEELIVSGIVKVDNDLEEKYYLLNEKYLARIALIAGSFGPGRVLVS